MDLRIWGFIDGTVRPMCRPGVHQRMFYNEHKSVHAMKFQAVTTPDGLICHLYGFVVGSRHDAGVLGESGLLLQLQQHMQLPAGPTYALFGDQAYSLNPYLQKANAGAALTQQQTMFNTKMATVEWWQKQYVAKLPLRMDAMVGSLSNRNLVTSGSSGLVDS